MSAAPNDFTFNTQSPTRADILKNDGPSTLRSSKSSPIPPPSKDEHVAARSMHWSFAFGQDGPGGDTQPMDSQIFKEYSEMGSSRIGMVPLQVIESDNLGTIEDSELVAQERNNVDLTDEDDDDDDAGVGVGEDDHNDDVSSPTALPVIQAQTASLFKYPSLPPRTPLNPSTKRKRENESMTPDVRSSSAKGNGTVLRNLLGGHAGMPNLGNMSQLFMNTQVGSSPAPAAPHSDSPFNKPSPSMGNGQFPMRDYSASSPVRPSTSDGIGRGPVNLYRNMDESQESRARRERQQQELTTDGMEDDEIYDSLPSQQRRLILQRKKQEFISNIELSAPHPLYRSPLNSRSKSVDHLSSERYLRTPASKLRSLQPISPEPASDHAQQEDLSEDVPEEGIGYAPSSRVQVPMTSSKRRRTSQSGVSQVPSPSSSQRTNESHAATQLTVAVQDSQSDRQVTNVYLNTGVRHLTSSARSGHLVQQSQYSDLTSETRAIMSQRLRAGQAAQARKHETAAVSAPFNEETIPSSPPVEFSEHDNEYEGDSDVEIVSGDHETEDITTRQEGPHVSDRDDNADVRLEDTDVQIEDEAVDLLPNLPHIDGQDDLERASRDEIDSAASKLVAGLRSTSLPPDRENEDDSRQRATVASTATEVFDTAATYQSLSSSRRVQELSQSEHVSQASPVKRFQDIANAPVTRPPGASYDSQELDDVIGNILSDQDQDFLELVSKKPESPRRKRLKTYADRPKALQEPSLNVNIAKPRKASKVAFAAEEAVFEDEKGSWQTDEGKVRTSQQKQSSSVPDLAESAEQPEAASATAALEARKVVARRKIAPLKAKKPQARNRASNVQRAIVPEDTEAEVEDPAASKSDVPCVPAEESQGNAIDETPPTSSAVRQYLPSAPSAVATPAPSAHKVLALFKGNTPYYYPATYLETILPENDKCKVRFCDGTVAIVDTMQIRILDVRINDCVKVDIAGMRKGQYLILDFDDTSDASFTDINGHKAVKVVPKATDGAASSTQTPVVVPIESIYLTGVMLPTFSDRKFVPPTKTMERLSTPALQQISEPTTPGSRTRKSTFSTSMNGIDSKLSTFTGLFSNMLFAITFVSDRDEALRVRLAKEIAANGGGIVDSGFEEIFELSASEPTSPKKSPRRSTPSTDATQDHLRLHFGSRSLGFTAVIADRHSRKKKFMQALALGVPCLHHRWISDCIAQSKVLPFDRYLLPAGESEFLGGAIRSRAFATFKPSGEDANLQNLLHQRPLPFHGLSLLLVATSIEKRKTYQFLAYAAGATNVKCVHNANEAKKLIDAGMMFDWILCDGDKSKMKQALSASSKQEQAGKKRKRGSDVTTSAPAQRSEVRVADSELLVQSLILGAVAE
jgi:hypothetical protein